MKIGSKFIRLICGLCLTVVALNTHAEQQGVVDLAYPAHAYLSDTQTRLLVEETVSQEKYTQKSAAAMETRNDFKEPLFTGAKAHQYLGLATLVAAAATALNPAGGGCEGAGCNVQTKPPRDTNGTHAQLAKVTGVLAVATVITGLITHWDDFALEDGWADPDNLHVLLGVTGAAAMVYAINKSANSTTPVSHAGIAELGAAAMAIGVRLTW